jgi:acetate kinase
MLVFEPGFGKYNWYRIEEEAILQGSVELYPGKVSLEAPNLSQESDRIGYVLPHGAGEFSHTATFITPETLARVERCLPFWPEQNLITLQLMQDGLMRFPKTPQLLLCETALFAHLPAWAGAYALPAELHAQGLRRYGGDGFTHQWTWQSTCSELPEPRRLVSIHLCDRPNLAAITGGQAVETSLGFTPVEGLPSLASSGDVDPEIVLLLNRQGIPAAGISDLLLHQSGWQTIAGPGRLVDLLGKDGLVFQMLRAGILKAFGAAAAALGGVDGLVFTCDERSRWLAFMHTICLDLGFANLTRLDQPDTSQDGAWALSVPQSGVKALALEASYGRILYDLFAGINVKD